MVRIFHKVKHCTNGDVKCLADAFDNCANVGFGRLAEQFGGIEEVIITKLSTSPKQSPHNEEVADALHSKTRNFNRTEQYTPRLMIIFTPCPPNLVKYL